MYKIFNNIPYEILYEGKDFIIEGIEYDSRNIKQNFVFVAMIGNTVDGHDFIQKAIDNGAKMILVEKKVNFKNYINYKDITFIFIENIRKKLGIIASNYYDFPQNKLKIIGITGTNGKTTSSYILENILTNSSRIGTTGNRILNIEKKTKNTTPESLELIKLIDESVKKGVEYFIMEVSSHALEMGRVDMLEFDSTIFTNLSQDHLDFHKTIENYFNAKKKLFSKLRKKGISSINTDDTYGQQIFNEFKDNCISFSTKKENSFVYGQILKIENDGMKIKIKHENKECTFKTNLIGEYNLYNILGCVSSLLSLGLKFEEIIQKLKDIPSIPGRFEMIKNDLNAKIIVDFAHTDDGLENIGKSLKEITDKKLITIFGAGGDRDKEKRPKMAKASAKFSDFIILTSDNPRNENPKTILGEIEKGLIDIKFPVDKYCIIEDREKAIKYAIENLLNEGDSLLVAGKGHETYQIIGNETYHFDDREVINKYLKNINK